MPPTVSVITPFYNAEAFLPEAISSVLAQTWTDWELLLVDDGSTDGSTALARHAAQDHADRVRYAAHPEHANRGASATRNLGISQARGRYLAFLDSDDVWEPHKLAEQVAILDTHSDVGLLFGASLYWWSWAGAGACSDRVRQVGAEPDKVHSPPSLLLQLYPLGKGIAPCPSSCIARRDVVERLGGFAEEFPRMYDDQTFLTRAYLATNVWVSAQCWDRYRQHGQSIMSTTGDEEYRFERTRFLQWFEGHLRRTGISDPRIDAALRRAWWPLRHPRLAEARRRAGVARSHVRRRYRRLRGRRR